MQGSSGSHEDEIVQAGLDEILAQEEAAEQDVLAQLRQRAASLERDLLQRSLSGLAPNSKVALLCVILSTAAALSHSLLCQQKHKFCCTALPNPPALWCVGLLDMTSWCFLARAVSCRHKHWLKNRERYIGVHKCRLPIV